MAKEMKNFPFFLTPPLVHGVANKYTKKLCRQVMQKYWTYPNYEIYKTHTPWCTLHDMNNNEHILSPAPRKRLHTMWPKKKVFHIHVLFFLLQLYWSIGQIMIKLHVSSDDSNTVCAFDMKHKRDAWVIAGRAEQLICVPKEGYKKKCSFQPIFLCNLVFFWAPFSSIRQWQKIRKQRYPFTNLRIVQGDF